MNEKVLVRNRKTGKEKMVPPGTAEMIKTEACFMEEWEVPKPGSPTPNEVVKFIERKENGEDLQPELVEFEKKSEDDLKEAGCKKTCEDLSVLSVKKLADRMEYLTPDQLEGLNADIRVSVVRMVEKELKKRKDEKSNTGN